MHLWFRAGRRISDRPGDMKVGGSIRLAIDGRFPLVEPVTPPSQAVVRPRFARNDGSLYLRILEPYVLFFLYSLFETSRKLAVQ